MKNERSKALIIGSALSLLYVAVALISYVYLKNSASSLTDVLAASVVSVIMLPHLILIFIGAIFNIIGLQKLKPNFILTAAILYSVGIFMFIYWGMYLIPGMVMMYVAYAKQKEIMSNGVNESAKTDEVNESAKTDEVNESTKG
ncbi:MAG: hypothetical protein ACRC5R_05855 [Mycoplasmatales bacterium]